MRKPFAPLFLLALLGCDAEESGEAADAAVADAAADARPSTCDVPAPTECPDPMPRYADVEPIFAERCVVCHYGQAGGPWPLNTYGHVTDWHDTIRAAMLDCSMPPLGAGVGMTVEERVAILTWLRCGFPR